MKTQLITLEGQHLLHLLDHVSDALVFANHAGEIVHLNNSARQIETITTWLHHPGPLHLDTLPLESIPLAAPLDNFQVFRLIEPAPARQPNNALVTAFASALQAQPNAILRAFDSLGLCIALLDEHNTIRAMNSRARLLLPAGKPGDSAAALLPELHSLLTSPRATPLETFIIDLEKRRLVGCALGWQDSAGRHKLLMCIEPPATDSDEFMRVGLLRMLIHDLANPLYIALNFGRLLQDNIITGEEIVNATEIIINNLQRMQDLLSDLSNLEQLGENIANSFTTVELATSIATVVANLDEYARSQHVSLQLTPLPEENCPIHGNDRLLRQALHNLVENALKYTLPGGWVRVTVRPAGQRYEILVADNGIGIDPAQRSHLFTPFYRVKDPRMQEVSGTGLGLSLVQMVANQHGGQVRLHSIPNKGSIFVIELPRHSTQVG